MNTKLQILDETSERGVQNPRVVDLISFDSNSRTVTLLMIEPRPWGVEKQVEQLEEKFNNYLDYVLDGFFSQQYPQYVGLPVVVCLQSKEAATEDIAQVLAAMGEFARSVGIAFEVGRIS